MNEELKKRASKCFTNPKDALVSFKELVAKKTESNEKYNEIELTRIFKDITLSLEGNFKKVEALEKKLETIWEGDLEKRFLKEIAELKESLKATDGDAQHRINQLYELKELSERNRKQIDELKVFRHHVAMPRIIVLEEVLRVIGNAVMDELDFYDEIEKRDKVKKALEKLDSGGEKESLNERDSVVSDSKYLSHEDDSKLPEPKFMCGNCAKMFKAYHDGQGINTGFCPNCLTEYDTVGLDEKLPEPKPSMICGDGPEPEKIDWKYLETTKEMYDKLIEEFLEKIDIWLDSNYSIYWLDIRKTYKGRIKE